MVKVYFNIGYNYFRASRDRLHIRPSCLSHRATHIHSSHVSHLQGERSNMYMHFKVGDLGQLFEIATPYFGYRAVMFKWLNICQCHPSRSEVKCLGQSDCVSQKQLCLSGP